MTRPRRPDLLHRLRRLELRRARPAAEATGPLTQAERQRLAELQAFAQVDLDALDEGQLDEWLNDMNGAKGAELEALLLRARSPAEVAAAEARMAQIDRTDLTGMSEEELEAWLLDDG